MWLTGLLIHPHHPPSQKKRERERKAGLHNVMTAFYSISEQRMITTGTCITAAFSCIIFFSFINARNGNYGLRNFGSTEMLKIYTGIIQKMCKYIRQVLFLENCKCYFLFSTSTQLYHIVFTRCYADITFSIHLSIHLIG
jgi:hypothetical protein